MTDVISRKKSTKTKNKRKFDNIYSKAIISRNVPVDIKDVGSNIKEILYNSISQDIDAKCIEEGFVKPKSLNIISYSSGLVNGTNINFQVVFECDICLPVEGSIINCVSTNITKAGIKAKLEDQDEPLIIFIARDHNYTSKKFSLINEGDNINVRIIGCRFELNDKYISAIAELVE